MTGDGAVFHVAELFKEVLRGFRLLIYGDLDRLVMPLLNTIDELLSLLGCLGQQGVSFD
jgi:hypothetical protein